MLSLDGGARLQEVHPHSSLKGKSHVQTGAGAPTDNGSQLADLFTTRERKRSGQHAFDKLCVGMGIEHSPGIRK